MTRFGAGAAAGGIGLSRFSGIIRAALVTNVLGIGLVGDAFAAAQRIPNVLQNLFGEGALSAAFIPEYSRLSEDDPREAGRLAGGVLSFLVCLVVCLVAIAFLAAEPFTRAIAWGFTGARFDLTVRLVRIILLGAGVLVLSAWCLAVLNSHRRFFVGYAAPVAWNATQIAVLIALAVSEFTDTSAAETLAWALVAGSVLQIVVQLPAVVRANRHIQFNFVWRNAATATVLKRFAPAVLGRGALQLSAFIDLALASLLSVGAASSLGAAQAIYLLPIALIATSVVAAELPELSRIDDPDVVAERLSRRLLQMLWLAGPIIALYLAAGPQIADALFNLGGFRNRVSPDDLTVIGLALGGYALGLPALMGSRLLQNVFYSVGDTRTPARIAGRRVVISLIVGAVLMFQFEQILVVGQRLVGFGDANVVWGPLPDTVRNAANLPARLGPVGLALGSAVGAWVEFWQLRKQVLARWSFESLTRSGFWKHVLPGLAALATALAVTQVRVDQALLHIFLIGVGVMLVHFAISLLLGTRTATELVSGLRRSHSISLPPEKDEPS
ncbi:MAG: murein biosynthesis integral membrane protein MurJ [Acidimicrobiales bacterium]|nr:murein biosynthesis integral membrane protein MurJ [Acidimicrobiales bacterium]